MSKLYKIPLVLSPQPDGVYGDQPGITGADYGGRHARRGHAERRRCLGVGAGAVRRSRQTAACQRPARPASRSDLVRVPGVLIVKYRQIEAKLKALGCIEIPRRRGPQSRTGAEEISSLGPSGRSCVSSVLTGANSNGHEQPLPIQCALRHRERHDSHRSRRSPEASPELLEGEAEPVEEPVRPDPSIHTACLHEVKDDG